MEGGRLGRRSSVEDLSELLKNLDHAGMILRFFCLLRCCLRFCTYCNDDNGLRNRRESTGTGEKFCLLSARSRSVRYCCLYTGDIKTSFDSYVC
jgi:hypothetical protein